MAEFINRKLAIAEIMGEPTEAHYPSWYAEKIKKIPTENVDCVRHAKWVDRYGEKYANKLYECSECKCRASYKFENDYLGIGMWVQDLSDYCPKCGSRMDGDDNA